jgi:nicotinamidase-related amidase
MSKSALLVIDMQRAFFEEAPLNARRDSLIQNCNELITYARQLNMPLFNIRTRHSRDTATWTLNMNEDKEGFLYEDSEGFKNLSGLDIRDATEVLKTRDSAFYETTLATMLRTLEVSSLLLCGVSAQACIFQTAADAYAHDFEVILARDAIGTDKPELAKPAMQILISEYRQTIASNDEIITGL